MIDTTLARRHSIFTGFVLASGLVFFKTWAALVAYSLRNESASHILLIPAIVFCLLFSERRRIFLRSDLAIRPGLTVVFAAVGIFWLATRLSAAGNNRLSLEAVSLVLLWIGGFITCYGFEAARAALFPLLFLLLMVPWPSAILDSVIRWLQEGSTDVTYAIFKALGIPVLRDGFVLTVPGVAIEVASECSGIRSSMALLITCLLAAHLYLRTTWRVLLFVLLVIPLSIIKNGIRIATLTLLSLYVNPDFLRGNLHRDGGFVFFLL
ncbi:MAG TPA: exosortase/archaeosortase family protein, partial [Blastocatellia bacterium]|nr:exosortase/archaeosortase family protein [Blastocatellia bacterium]